MERWAGRPGGSTSKQNPHAFKQNRLSEDVRSHLLELTKARGIHVHAGWGEPPAGVAWSMWSSVMV